MWKIEQFITYVATVNCNKTSMQFIAHLKKNFSGIRIIANTKPVRHNFAIIDNLVDYMIIIILVFAGS